MSKQLAVISQGIFSLTPVVNNGIVQYRIELPPEKIAARDEQIAAADQITEVTPENLELVKHVTSVLKTFDKYAEKDRVAAKAPFKESGDVIDNLAKEFKTPAKNAADRLESLLGEFIEGERQKAEAIRREQVRLQLEQERIERENQKREQDRLDELERQREAALKAGDVKTANELEEKKDELELAAAETKQEAPRPVVVFTPPPDTSGSAVSETFKFEVYDIQALFKAFPQFVQLTEKRGDLLAYIRLTNGKSIPGVTINRITKVEVRAK